MKRSPAPTLLVSAVFFVLASGCGSGSGDTSEPSTSERAIEGLQGAYDDLTESDLDAPVQWAAEDLENIGDWEYKILEMDRVPAQELETAMNELGDQRWEVIWIEKTLSGYMIFLKKPSVSYLSKIPLSQLGRLLMGDPAPEE